MGRLFDAVSSLVGICHRIGYEAQAAVELEGRSRSWLPGPAAIDERYRFDYRSEDGGLAFDPAPLLAAVVADQLAGLDPGLIGARFHSAVAGAVCECAERVRSERGLNRVALSGGVFLNGLLLSLCTGQLVERGFEVLRHRQVPPSDAGLALGQLVIAARQAEHDAQLQGNSYSQPR
jgi:hydrogenase maturation protein HypF